MLYQKRDYPVIFIGLGGTGKDAILTIKRKFEENFVCEANTGAPRRTGYLVLDADGENTAELGTNGYVPLRVPNLAALMASNSTERNEYENQWYNVHIGAAMAVEGAGAGCIRQEGRLQLFRHVDAFKTKFSAMLRNLAASDRAAGAGQMKVDVVICAGLTGGTGSGTFMDVAYLTKAWTLQALTGYTVNTYGFLGMPGLFMRNDGYDKRRKANAYAALKELDYWMDLRAHETRAEYVQNYPDGSAINWKTDSRGLPVRPFSLVFLMDNKFETGNEISGNAYALTMDKIAEMMLCSYADESDAANGLAGGVAGGNQTTAGFSFDSFMSNVAVGLDGINGDSRFPYNCVYSSLGFASTTEGLQDAVEIFERDAVLKDVLTVPLVSTMGSAIEEEHYGHFTGFSKDVAPFIVPRDTMTIMEKDEEKAAFLKAVFAPFEAETDFDMTLYIKSEGEKFLKNNPYNAQQLSGFDALRGQAGNRRLETLKNTLETNAGGTITKDTWYNHAYTFSEERYEEEWQRFVAEAKRCIKRPDVGPAVFACFLYNCFLPDLKDMKTKLEGKITEKKTDRDNAYNNMKTILDSISSSNWIDKGKNLFPGTQNTHMDNWRKEEKAAGKAQIGLCYAEERAKTVQKMITDVADYLGNLQNLCNVLAAMQQDVLKDSQRSDNQTDADASFITVKQVRDYLNSNASKNAAVAQAKDGVLNEIAEVSFRMDTPKEYETYEAKEQYKEKLGKQLAVFIDGVHKQMQMVSLDWIVDASIAKDATDTDKVNSAANNLAPWLSDRAVPMLPVDASAAEKKNTGRLLEYCYVCVPENAVTIIKGINQYVAQHGLQNTLTVKPSKIAERMLWVKTRTGFALADISGMVDLKASYWEFQNNPRQAAGFHLNDSVWAASFDSSLFSPVQSATLLPEGVSSALTQSESLTGTEKANLDKACEWYREALNCGMVEEDPINAGIRLNVTSRLISKEDFKEEIDSKIAHCQANATKLERLRAFKKAEIGQTAWIYWGKYLQSLLDSRNMKAPAATASRAEKEAYDTKKKELQDFLCAYLIMRCPDYMYKLKHSLGCVRYLNEKIQEAEEGIKQDHRLSVSRMLAAGLVSLDESTFVLKDANNEVALFEVKLDAFNKVMRCDKDLSDFPDTIRHIRSTYCDALFYLLQKENPSMLSFVAEDTWEKMCGALCSSKRELKIRRHDLYDQYTGALDGAVARLGGLAGRNGNVMLDERLKVPAEDLDLRQPICEAYNEMLETLKKDVL